MVWSTALASFSEKNFCLRILSSSSPPFISSVTRYTDCPSSYTYKQTKMGHRAQRYKSSIKIYSLKLTHVFQGDDVGVLSISQQYLNLLRWIPPVLIYNLQSDQTHWKHFYSLLYQTTFFFIYAHTYIVCCLPWQHTPCLCSSAHSACR